MKRLFTAVLVACGILSSAHAEPSPPITHVIYITFDGTRWQDVFNEHPYLPKFWKKYAKNGIYYGAPNSNTRMEVASIPISLPSYQSQMSGRVQPCQNNDCGRIHCTTLPEDLVHIFHFKKQDVAVFASWKNIAYAAESRPGTVYINAGNVPAIDPVTNQPDTVMAKINYQQTLRSQPPGERYDEFTFAQAMHYYEKYQPKFMWISLNDTDEAAHLNHKKVYHEAISFFDNALDQLFTMLEAMHLDKNTMVIITTDHGRGDGANWTSHGPDYPESKRTWSFVMNGALKAVKQEDGISYYSTLSIRPSVLAAFAHHN